MSSKKYHSIILQLFTYLIYLLEMKQNIPLFLLVTCFMIFQAISMIETSLITSLSYHYKEKDYIYIYKYSRTWKTIDTTHPNTGIHDLYVT